jgi:glutamate-1-semialdehyde 2,1-aminomutase
MAKVAPDGPVYQAGTLSGNPLAMAAGIAALAKLDRLDAWRVLAGKADALRKLAAPVLKKYEGNILLLQMESIFCLYFTGQKAIHSVDDVRRCDMKRFARFHGEMLKRGIYLSPSGYEVGFLSTAHSDGDLAKTAEAMAASLAAVMQA